MKVLMITNIFTTGTRSPTATVWPQQGSKDLTSINRQNCKMIFTSQIIIWISWKCQYSQIRSKRMSYLDKYHSTPAHLAEKSEFHMKSLSSNISKLARHSFRSDLWVPTIHEIQIIIWDVKIIFKFCLFIEVKI